ncbi:MAG TPA: response regulator [Anaerolineae bacterium]|nr:response regulator [Anaerolineae bacterium]
MLAGMESPHSAVAAQPILVALMCENPIVYQSLSSRLAAAEAIHVVDAIDCQLDNVPLVVAENPDVVILGIARITHFNLLVCQAIRQASAQTRIVVLPSYEADPIELQEAREAGASAILLKNIDTPKLVDQIHALVNSSA